jgi:hypothetical protein
LVALLACFLLGLWIVNGLLIFFRFSMKRLQLRRQIESPVFAGEPFSVTLEMHNPTRRNQRALRADDLGSDRRNQWFVPLLKKGQTQRRRKTVMLSKRGRYVWPILRLSSGYPFGLFNRWLRFRQPDETIVIPRLGKLHVGRLRRLLRYRPRLVHATQRPRRRHPVAQTDFYGLREFRPGDSPRWIHWRTTARVGELMVREFEEPPLDNLTVIVEPWLPDQPATLQANWDQIRRSNRALIKRLLASGPAPPPEKRRVKEEALARKEDPFRVPLENLEFALSLAATILWTWNRQPGARLALALTDERAESYLGDNYTAGVEVLLEQLGLVQGGPAPDTTSLVDRLATAPLPPGPLLLLTTHSSDAGDRLSAALGRHVTVLDMTQTQVKELFELGKPM